MLILVTSGDYSDYQWVAAFDAEEEKVRGSGRPPAFSSTKSSPRFSLSTRA